jgi:hypothetical protein
MRFASYVALAAALGLLVAAMPVEAQTGVTQKKRPQIVIKKRSYLDAGTTVKPGSQNYHDYAFGPAMRNPSYGTPGIEGSYGYGEGRWPMLRWWEGY